MLEITVLVEDVKKDLLKLSDDIRQAAKRALAHGLMEARDEAATLLNAQTKMRTATLLKGIGISMFATSETEGKLFATARTRDGKDNYASFIERGTVAHFIRPKRDGGWLRFPGPSGKEWVFTKAVWHPGNKAMPFLWPAALIGQYRAIRQLQAEIDTFAERFSNE